MRIGELARKAGVTAQAVRLYERRGLLHPTTRTEAGYRVYEDSDLQALKSIKRAQQLGFSLREIKEMRDLHSRPGDLGRARKIMEDKLQVLRDRIAWLEEMRAELQRSLLGRPPASNRCPAAPPEIEGANVRRKR